MDGSAGGLGRREIDPGDPRYCGVIEGRALIYHAYLAQFAYNQPSEFVSGAPVYGLDQVRAVGGRGPFAYVARRGTDTEIIFRGTESQNTWLEILNDWATNFGWRKVETPFGKVHRGFWYAYQSLEWQIRQALDDIGTDLRRIVCVGHSQGGALAEIAGALLRARVTYTYGQPRVGDLAWRQWWREHGGRLLRVVNGGDPVVRVPFLNFWHPPAITVGRGLWDIGDHAIGRYIAALQAEWGGL